MRDLNAHVVAGLARRLGHGERRVIWSEDGDEVLVHLDTLKVERAEDAVIVHLEIEADDHPRELLCLAFVLGQRRDGVFRAVTSEQPAGSGSLAARWTDIAQDMVWAALRDLLDGAQHTTPQLLDLVRRRRA